MQIRMQTKFMRYKTLTDSLILLIIWISIFKRACNTIIKTDPPRITVTYNALLLYYRHTLFIGYLTACLNQSTCSLFQKKGANETVK